MAAGALVPHTLPNGQTVMVPDYLVPKGAGALAMPAAPKPQEPDLRVAGPGGGPSSPGGYLFGVPGIGSTSLPTKPIKKAIGWVDPEKRGVPEGSQRAAEIAAREPPPAARSQKQGTSGGVDTSTLLRGPAAKEEQAPQGDSDDAMDPMVRKVFNESLRGGGGGGPRRSPGLEIASMQQSREPGKELLPEYKWAHGLEARPDLGQEIDPDAEQPTWGTADPVMRDRKTGIERGAEASGVAARSEFERQVQEQREMGVAQREQLLAQSQLIDEQLDMVAQRRNRIAQLQEVADKRMREAESMEPRTKSEVWESKSGVAQAMAFLSVALGGYTAGLGRNGGKNAGWDMLNNFLDAEVEGERHKAESRKKLGLEARNDVERAMAMYGDLDMAALESKNRKLANVMAMTQQMMAAKGLDATAKMRGEQVYAAAQEQFLANQQQLFDQIAGKVTREEINYKPGVATGGGGGAPGTLEALEKAARAKKAINTIAETGQKNPERPVIEGTIESISGALDTVRAARGVKRGLGALDVTNNDIDDPRSGAYDYVTKNIPGTETRRVGQDLDLDTEQLARGAQQFLGKSDNDAALAERAAKGLGGSGRERFQSAQRLEEKAINRIKLSVSGMTPDQRNAWFKALPPDQREIVNEALGSDTRRGKTEAPIE